MKNDFKPIPNHRFNFQGDWGAVDCQVLTVEANKSLSYTWEAQGLESVVTWILTPTGTGTHLRMEQSGLSGKISHSSTKAPRVDGLDLSRPWKGVGPNGLTRDRKLQTSVRAQTTSEFVR